MRLAFLASPLINRKNAHGQEWIYGALFCTIEAASILVLNLILFLVAVHEGYNGSIPGKDNIVSIPIYEGKCTVANRWSTGLHVIINILSTWLLAASNYVMQCLNAPSRADLDRAHAQGRWLYVGTWGFKNFQAMDWKRKTLWAFYNSVVFPSISTQQYGPVLIPHTFAQTDSLLRDNDSEAHRELADWVGYNATELHAEIFNGTMKKMSRRDCAKRYSKEYNTDGGTVMVVTNATRPFDVGGKSLVPSTRSLPDVLYSWMYQAHILKEPTAANLLHYVPGGPDWSVLATWWNYPRWNFTAPAGNGSLRQFDLGPTFTGFYSSSTDPDLRSDLQKLYWFIAEQNPDANRLSQFLSAPENWSNNTWVRQVRAQMGNSTGRRMLDTVYYFDMPQPNPDWNFPVSHCLSKDAKQRCQLLFSLPIAIIVLACNCIKLICMFLAAKSVNRREVLLTVGDAVASFLTRPDPTTRGRCLLSHADVRQETEIWTTTPGIGPPHAEIALEDLSLTASPSLTTYPTRVLPSRLRWFRASSSLYWACFAGCIATGAGLYHFGAWVNNGIDSVAEAWERGFGKVSPDTLVTGPDWPDSLLQIILLVNLPQILLSLIYFIANGLLTRMFLAVEYNDYSVTRKPLRVSWPIGQQRRAYYLSLPLRYGLSMMVMSIALHWLLSQSWFLVKIRTFGLYGEILDFSSVTTCGYSLAAMFLTLIIGGLAMVLVLALGMRKFQPHMPLASYCSIAISAACHPPSWDVDAALKPVMWGEVKMRRNTTSTSTAEEDTQRHDGYHAGPEHAHCTFSSLDVTTPNTTSLYC
ncbi:hypothetical protein N7492_007947 [Penicillium capsulatum]|uniref:DUF6536 domain-containing protein n=1 Tax=Penicillium capsulatum TaxID=69766 RepID=A0A9W9LG97_9EURO|nr:hypothetical protein N7492_007947 [Penicillium capsulatum]